MAVVRKFGQLLPRLLVANKQAVCVRTSSTKSPREQPWYEAWDAGPYPRTEEERRAAAEKYNLHPDEYQPFPEEYNYGDYPMLPLDSPATRNPYFPWDFPSLRTNYKEPLHVDFDMMGVGPESYGAEPRQIPFKTMAATLIGVIGFISVLTLVVGDTNPPVLEKQYPRNGVHYTFEPAK